MSFEKRADIILNSLESYAKKGYDYSRFFDPVYKKNHIFLNVPVPKIRKVALEYVDIDYDFALYLLGNVNHSLRLFAVFILIAKYESGDKNSKKVCVNFCVDNAALFSCWDLIDACAHKILGHYSRVELGGSLKFITYLINRDDVWAIRFGIVSLLDFARNNFQLQAALNSLKPVVSHKHIMVSRPVGWIIREIGKKDIKVYNRFLIEHKDSLSLMATRYARFRR